MSRIIHSLSIITKLLCNYASIYICLYLGEPNASCDMFDSPVSRAAANAVQSHAPMPTTATTVASQTQLTFPPNLDLIQLLGELNDVRNTAHNSTSCLVYQFPTAFFVFKFYCFTNTRSSWALLVVELWFCLSFSAPFFQYNEDSVSEDDDHSRSSLSASQSASAQSVMNCSVNSLRRKLFGATPHQRKKVAFWSVSKKLVNTRSTV